MSDIVTPSNAHLYRRAFAANVGHTEACIEETIDDMVQMLQKVCVHFCCPIDEIVNRIGVESFDVHLQKILASKQCDCATHKKIIMPRQAAHDSDSGVHNK